MKLYIVTEGEYSDYHIVFVTEKKEVAEWYVENSRDDDVGIEEYDLLNDLNELKESTYHRWYVDFDENLELVNASTYDTIISKERPSCDVSCEKGKPWYREPCAYIVVVYTLSEESAIKIAKEKLTQYMAKEKGLI